MRLKQALLYREARHIWRAFFVFGHGFSYLYHRFIIGPRIRSLGVTDRPVETNEYSVHMLCSHKDVTMMLWSLASWYRALPSGMAGKVYIHEDGSFTAVDKELVGRLLPHAQIVEATKSDSVVFEKLADYPETKKFRLQAGIPLMRKLIDPYFTGDRAYKLILDTDILWFGRPDKLMTCIRENVVCASKGYTEMSFSGDLQEKSLWVNSGIVGYPTANFSLKMLEEFCHKIPRDADPHFIEQAGYGYVLGQELSFLPDDIYHIKGPLKHGTVAKHFTGPRREMFWFEGVRTLRNR